MESVLHFEHKLACTIKLLAAYEVFLTEPLAIGALCMALTVTNALGNGKRADIVFYGLTFETLLFF